MEQKFKEKIIEALEENQAKGPNGEWCNQKHNSLYYEKDGTEVVGELCDGTLYWEPVLEGFCCTKCNANTSLR